MNVWGTKKIVNFRSLFESKASEKVDYNIGGIYLVAIISNELQKTERFPRCFHLQVKLPR